MEGSAVSAHGGGMEGGGSVGLRRGRRLDSRRRGCREREGEEGEC